MIGSALWAGAGVRIGVGVRIGLGRLIIRADPLLDLGPIARVGIVLRILAIARLAWCSGLLRGRGICATGVGPVVGWIRVDLGRGCVGIVGIGRVVGRIAPGCGVPEALLPFGWPAWLFWRLSSFRAGASFFSSSGVNGPWPWSFCSGPGWRSAVSSPGALVPVPGFPAGGFCPGLGVVSGGVGRAFGPSAGGGVS